MFVGMSDPTLPVRAARPARAGGAARLAVALVLAALAVAATVAAAAYIPRALFVLSVGAVTARAWYGGLWAGCSPRWCACSGSTTG
jgi:hypothetical protein